MSSWSSHSRSSPDSSTVALQISVIRRHSKCLFQSGRQTRGRMCQHFEGDITLNAWLAACISVALQTLGKQNRPSEQKQRSSAYLYGRLNHFFFLKRKWKCGADISGVTLFLTISAVNSGGLSLTSVILMTAVAVLERPYMGLPSMSVAWMISVYWGTFWEEQRDERAGLKHKFFGLWWFMPWFTENPTNHLICAAFF